MKRNYKELKQFRDQRAGLLPGGRLFRFGTPPPVLFRSVPGAGETVGGVNHSKWSYFQRSPPLVRLARRLHFAHCPFMSPDIALSLDRSPARAVFSATVRKALWRLNRATPQVVKRLIDACVAGLVLLFCLPVFAGIAMLIRLEDGGPVLYWQTRVGRYGRTFRFPKFRSMVVNAEAKLAEIQKLNQHGDTITFKMKHDPRITRVGRTLRRFSLDELPQLWCVLNGDMSLVGPRPALPREVANYSLEARRRLDVTPGLTCIWQVSGRSQLAFPIQCRMDVDYIDQQSLKMDIKLLALTVPAVISGKGAY